MKKSITALALSAFFLTGFSQDLKYEVRGKYSRPAKKEALSDAKLIRDVIPGYPVNWITRYVAVEITGTCGGALIKAGSKEETLSAEQKKLLMTADLGSNIVVDVVYEYQNPLTPAFENRTIHAAVTVVPDVQAEFPGGDTQMKKYLKENYMDRISETIPKEFQKGKVQFTVGEDGRTNARIVTTSGNIKMDQVLLEAIHKMPKWKPAENSNGIKVKQEFEFSVGSFTGC